MICAMATTKVKPGAEEALVAAAQDHATALRAQPGCRGTYVLLERGTRVQVSISLFDDAPSLQRALDATRPVIARHRIDQLWESPPSFAVLDVR